MHVARGAAESVTTRQRYLESLERDLSNQAAYHLAPGSMCMVEREHAPGNDQRPGRVGPFLVLHADSTAAWVLVDGRPKAFLPSKVHAAVASNRLQAAQFPEQNFILDQGQFFDSLPRVQPPDFPPELPVPNIEPDLVGYDDATDLNGQSWFADAADHLPFVDVMYEAAMASVRKKPVEIPVDAPTNECQ
jgi:hypothetical protein